MRVGEVGVDLQRLFGRGGSRRRIFARERLRDAQMGRRPVSREREGLLERLQRFGLVVGLERHLAPRGFDSRIGASPDGAEHRFHVPHAAERVRGTCRAEQPLLVGSLEM